MNLIYPALYILLGLALGAGTTFLLQRLSKKQFLKDAQLEADEILNEAKLQYEAEEIERKERVEEIELDIWSTVEEAHQILEHKCEDLDAQVQLRKSTNDEKYKNLRSALLLRENELRDLSIKLTDRQTHVKKIQNLAAETEQKFRMSLLQKTGLVEMEVVSSIQNNIITDAQRDFDDQAEKIVEESKEFSEQKAKRILSLAMERFQKEMSTERGIQASYFPTEDIKKHFLQNLSENVKTIQSITGCDIHIDENNSDPDRWDYIQIIGFDPVRRELSRRIFDRIFRDIERNRKMSNSNDLLRTCENIRTELLNQIKRDGDLIVKELGLQNVNSEIRQVMGALRFRYSYTQNQYFHCAEVGWFCGLLAGELNLEVKKFRRAGMLHDLGKALDHDLDGSHAVIGADFIAARGESDEVIHAVRAHHHDVTPEAELDFLVIAADAISGARPGARRSTMETYTQKVSGLQEISKRFRGVTDVFVLNGGRECRVLVNARQVDDSEAISISQNIAKTIEDEMQYPGQIKVVVVRETVTSESTLGRNKDR